MSKKIKLKLGDLVINYYDKERPSGVDGILHKRFESYYDEGLGRQVPVFWEVFGWTNPKRIMDSFLKNEIKKGYVDHYPMKKWTKK
jgi:hypothetical protein